MQAGETELNLTPPDAFQRLIAHGLVGAQPCIAVTSKVHLSSTCNYMVLFMSHLSPFQLRAVFLV